MIVTNNSIAWLSRSYGDKQGLLKASEADLNEPNLSLCWFQLKRKAMSRKPFRPLRLAIYIDSKTIQSQKSR